uniref:Scavenger receptor class F member 1 n=1 Tax=Malurus cyaneus samueli TaxID=2593467 RepID=A0A8C5X173_9PASS
MAPIWGGHRELISAFPVPTALCEGEDACREGEVCLKPGLCRCKPGFFGADCSSRCPEQYWGHDCKRSCPCHPNGRCDPVSGRCTCDPNHWGGLCQFPCPCGPHGRCDPLTGACHCEPGWWAPNCRKQCQCNPSTSQCDALTGLCRCLPGWWGRRCSFKCSCNISPCAQETGKCECLAGFWGPACQWRCDCGHGSCNPLSGHCTCEPGYQGRSCREPCPAGKYGSHCVHSCGSCKRSQPCSPVDGFCLACQPGWNGTLCKDPCAPGFHGEGCLQPCPRCRHGEPCDPQTGSCLRCDPALAAAILVPLLLLLLCVACCCCGAGSADARDRAAVPDDDVVARMKHHVQGVLANLSALVPCFNLGSSKLPKVTVSHHDTEIPFNPSFIEPPSSAWVSDSSFSSLDTDNEGPEYSVPPREGIPLLGGAELQDGPSPPGQALPDPSAFDSEDVSQPFAIPRTSSIAKAKRPSVSFAEGTKFGAAETPSPGRKPKSPWGPARLTPPPGDAAAEPPGERPNSDCYENPEPLGKGDESHRPSPRATPGGRRRVVSGTRHVAQRVEALEAAAKSGSWEGKGKGKEPNVTTIYMMVGTAGQDPKAEGTGEGPVQAVLKRLGSLQKGKWAAKEEPKVRRSMEGIQKPPRRALAQRRDSENSCKQRDSVPGAPAEPAPGKQQHPAAKRLSLLLASLSSKNTGAQDAAGEATERSKSPELAVSLERKGQAAAEEEPKYENVASSGADSPFGPGKEPPAAPPAT